MRVIVGILVGVARHPAPLALTISASAIGVVPMRLPAMRIRMDGQESITSALEGGMGVVRR